MAKNFVVVYSSREGSTAIINTLSGQDGIHIPVVEDLDEYRFTRQHKKDEIYEVLDKLFATGEIDKPDHVENHLLQNAGPYQSIGLKWRKFGDNAKLAALFKKHNVVAFFLSRRSFLDIVCSTYVHETFGDSKLRLFNKKILQKHPQFALANKSPEQKKTTQSAIDKLTFGARKSAFLDAARQRVAAHKKYCEFAEVLSTFGVEIQPIAYEDFDSDKSAFFRKFTKLIELDIAGEPNINCKFIKVYSVPLSDRIRKLDRLIGDTKTGRQYQELEAEYSNISDRFQELSGEKKGDGKTIP